MDDLPNAELLKVDLSELLHDSGAANRIVAGDLLRTLSQEIPAAACHLHNDIDVEEAEELLVTNVTIFDVVLDALLNGNPEIGIEGAETSRRTAVEIEHMIADWEPIHDAALKVLDNHDDAVALNVIYDAADIMFEKTYHLLSVIETEYSNPTEILQEDVMLLEISGRMAAMNQRLAYEACRVWSHDGDSEMIADLQKSMGIYEGSLMALTNGMPSLGIVPPPTQEIAAKLAEIGDHWEDVHMQLEHVATGDEISEEERFALYHGLVEKLHRIEELEVLYQDHSKRIY
ncbi:type IV pili methyl-accepting chemotaxis transducer N-terminal domain-containing protein [Yoonia sp. F2084L]|nr:type IV pili methyl-accepting chemotaxis transducer N-terminal domain-containing protein [Yoonia sp. F2084L]